MLIRKGLRGLKIIYVDRLCMSVTSDVFKETHYFPKNRLARLWNDEVNKRGKEKASFLRVWLKFAKTRIIVTLVIIAINAVSTFLESVCNVSIDRKCIQWQKFLLFFFFIYLNQF